jgi:predicted Ser/Thr protein kinase
MLAGKQVGPFAIEKEIGHGAMGAVYLAAYSKTGQRVALKVISPGLADSDRALARFEREVALLKQLHHPNIVRFFGTGRYKRSPFYVMEYVEGESLDRVLHRRQRMPWQEVVEIGTQVCAALQHAHEQGIIHRDLKPSNLLLMADGTVKLADFGIAKHVDLVQLTATNTVVGTAAYMSPEQCRTGVELTHRSDLYSLGVVLYELLTGRTPFHAENAIDMFLQHTKGRFERPARVVLEIPVWLDQVVCHLMEKKPEKRPPDAAAVAQALNQVVERVAGKQTAETRIRKRGVAPAPAAPENPTMMALTGLIESDLERERDRYRERPQPFYGRVWFKAAVLSVLLLGVAGALYATLRPPPPEKLYTEAERLMKSEDPEDWDKAKEGPIADFLSRYPDRPEVAQVRAWSDQADVYRLERKLQRGVRLARQVGREFKSESDLEDVGYRATDYEDFGDFFAARDLWAILRKESSKASADRVWTLLAEKKLREAEEKLPRDADEKQARKKLVEDKLAEAVKLKSLKQSRQANQICQAINNLYRNEPDPDLAEIAAKARDLLKADAK